MPLLRRLAVEVLEPRDVPSIGLRIAEYNITSSDGSGVPRSGLDVILKAIGDEATYSPAHPLDILALQEVQSQATTSQAVVNLLNNIYGAGTYARGTLNGGTTGSGTQGIVYNTQTIQLLSEAAIGTASTSGQPRQALRYKLHAIGAPASDDFYLYNSHYKADSDSTSQSRRQVEAQAIRADADSLGQGANILYVGDFNCQSSGEQFFQTLLSSGNGQAFDPLNRLGNWHNNSSFLNILTQAPAVSPPAPLSGGGLDDRFDFQLVSGELTDSAGLEYSSGTYHTLGNNGSVPLNANINDPSSTALPGLANRITVLNDLTTVSDHLPTVADYTIASTSPTTTSLMSSLNPSIFGQSVTFTATVTPSSPTPTGTVTFQDGAATIGTGTLNGSGVATFTTSTLATGPHSITAAYGGDGNYNGSTSSAVNQVVNADQPPALVNGAAVIYTATGTGNASDPLAPNLTITDPDGTTLASATVTIANPQNGADEGLTVPNTTGTNIGVASYNPATGVLTLAGTDTLANYQAVLRTVKYFNNPASGLDTTTRTITFQVNDGALASNAAPSTVTFATGRLFFPGMTALAGQTITVPVRFTTDAPGPFLFASADIAITFDPAVFTIQSVAAGSLLPGFSASATIDNTAGFVRAGVFGPTTLTLAGGSSGSVLDLVVLVNPAATGATPLNLAAAVTSNGSTTTTKVDGFPELLSTRPTDNPGDANVDGTLTIDSNAPLQVTGVTATPSGVAFNFNRTVDPSQVNLYDSPGGNLGSADLTLVGATTGPVRGSLVFDPSSHQATFVKTGGLLAPDTYTLTLVSSAASGFRSLDGQALDGDADGNPGGNYVNGAITVAASSLPVIAVPNFARGAEQAVNIPASGTAGIPVAISNASAVTQVGFDLVYDPTLLTIAPTGAVSLSAAAAAAGLVLQSYSITGIDANHARLTVAVAGGSGWNPANGATLVTIAATVPPTAPYGSKAVLNFQNVLVNNAAARGDAGVQVAAYLGDASGDKAYSALDAALINQVGIGAGTGFAKYKDLDPAIIGDVSGDGALAALDASLINSKGSGGNVPQIPNIPNGVTPPSGGPDPRLYFVSAQARPGLTVTVQLRLKVTAAGGIDLAALDEAIRFDPRIFTISNVRTGAQLAAHFLFTTTAGTVDNVNGILRVGQFYSGQPVGPNQPFPHLANGMDWAVLEFDVTVNPNAAVGMTTSLNLARDAASNGSTTTTAVSDANGALTLIPAPTNRPDDQGVDAVFRVLGPGQRVVTPTPPGPILVGGNPVRDRLSLNLPFAEDADPSDAWGFDWLPRRSRRR